MSARPPLRAYSGEQRPAPQQTMFQRVLQKMHENLLIFVIGIFLLAVGTGLLFWNEGRAVQAAHSLDEGLSVVHSLTSADVIANENNEKLIHFSGPLNTFTELHDDVYGISISAVRLKRKVEMYQWVETEHKREVQELDRIRTDVSYSYSTEWKSELINSDTFDIRPGHHNPTSWPVESHTQTADRVQVGSYLLSANMIEKINNYKQLTPTRLPNNNSHMHLYQAAFYHGSNPQWPQVGDIRVTFEYAGYSGKPLNSQYGQADVVSVIGRQERNHVTGYQTKSGDDLELLYIGDYSAQAMFASEKASNALLTWALRLLGWLIMFLGYGCTTSIITVLADWLPLIRDAVSLGVTSMNAVLAISSSLAVIAIGWLWYRPIFAGTIFLVAALPFVLLSFRSQQHLHYRTAYHNR